MATNPPPYSHIMFTFRTESTGVGFFPCSSVALTIVDHRQTTAAPTVPQVLIPCPGSHFSARLYRASVEEMAKDLCNHHLHLRSCCASRLVPRLTAKIAAVNAAHRCYGIQNVQLHVFPHLMPMTDLSIDATLRESFETAEPKPTPASLASIEKLVAEKEGDEYSCSRNEEDGDSRSCRICLDQIITRRSSLKMPCSHVFHQNCIVQWLKVSHFCPLCRYEMPVDDNSAANSDH